MKKRGVVTSLSVSFSVSFLLVFLTANETDSFSKEKTRTTLKSMTGAHSQKLPDVLKRTYGEVKTLTCEFEQRKKNLALGGLKESKGVIEIKRPDKFRWETFSPEKSLLVTNGLFSQYYTPPFREGEKGQVVLRKAADTQSKAAIDLLSGSVELQKTFRSIRIKESHYELKPLKPLGDIERIELFLEKQAGLVYKLVLIHTTGNETELTLNKVKLGAPIEDSRFEFNPPKDTDVIK